ncbi:hypothetical protein [Ruficoccus sp. ZRK36]|uniref:hypothetical protein n=1 Tax=Ruficoccus sp. ZRK36 TaxID=2866311 RepID=UPI001C73A0F7|nr:hypothetical protein [Ruficoccus sp. ZRK36]QYY35067.1 hypothetical protein K0V07_12240 [Ruficoccus sp. ZRK36]
MDKNQYFAYRSFWPEPEGHRRFADTGGDTVCFFAGNTTNSLAEPYCKYAPSWHFTMSGIQGQYEFSPVDQQIADLTANCPGSRLICMVDLNTPEWLSRHKLKCDSFNQLGRLTSDPAWRETTAAYMEALIRHIETNHPGRVTAYVLACGGTCEWYDNSNLSESRSRTKAWNEYQTQQGKPAEDIPGLNARTHVSFDGLLRDPQTDGTTLEYIGWCADEISDAIEYFLKKARACVSDKTELGVFFGYPLVLQDWRVIVGNNDCRRLLACEELDFLISPQGGFAFIGMGSGDLGPTESIRLHGKGYLRECDQQTHTSNLAMSEYAVFDKRTWDTEEKAVAGLKRELANSLLKRTSLWWFDMWGGYYETPDILGTLAKSREIYATHISDPVVDTAEIALIIDPESIYYLNQHDSRVKWFYNETKRALDCIGAPWECYHFDDIPAIPNRERIKFWILPAIFEMTEDKLEILRQYVQTSGTGSLYLYAPGISDGESLDPERVAQICGTPWGTPGATTVERDGHRLTYVHQGEELTSAVLKQAAAASGVHLYCEQEQPVYANSRFVAVHTAEGGRQRIALPSPCNRATELFTGQTIEIGGDSFEYTFKKPDTALFKLES